MLDPYHYMDADTGADMDSSKSPYTHSPDLVGLCTRTILGLV